MAEEVNCRSCKSACIVRQAMDSEEQRATGKECGSKRAPRTEELLKLSQMVGLEGAPGGFKDTSKR